MSVTFDEGQSVTTEVEFRMPPDPGETVGDLFNPTTVTLTYRNPNGTTGIAANSNVSLGIYRGVISSNIVGVWRFRWEGTTGSTTLVDEGSYCIEDSAVLV